jgi:hypothetical protein
MNNHLRSARILANLMDAQFKLFGFRFGLDPILGIIPGFGDLLSLGLSAYIVWIGVQMGLPTAKLAQMISNIIFDFLLGSIPVVGDLFDVTFKANLKNLSILEGHQPTSNLAF